MTTHPPARRLLRRAALVATGALGGTVALTVTLVSAVGHSAAADIPTSTSTSSSSTPSGSTSDSSSGGTGLSPGDQSQAPVGGSNGS